jgi:hypothetical protein
MYEFIPIILEVDLCLFLSKQSISDCDVKIMDAIFKNRNNKKTN